MRVLWLFDVKPNKLGGLELFAARIAKLYPVHQFTIGFDAAPSHAVTEHFEGGAALAVVPEQSSFSPRAMARTARLLRELRPHLVVYSLGGIIRPLPWLCRLAGARVVYMDETSRTSNFRARGLKGVIQRFFARPVSLVIAASHFTRDIAVRENLFRCPATTVPNGIQPRPAGTSRADFRARFAVPLDAIVIAQCSSLTSHKGVDLLLGAAARVKTPGVHFVIAGEGTNAAAYQEMARGLPVTFTGPIDDPMGEGLYAAADIFCLPSRWQECCGFVNLEAMAFGLPVVASRVGGIPEFVTDGQCGFLIEPAVDDLVAKLQMLLDNPALRHAMGENGKRRVQDLFSLDAMVHAYAHALGLSGSNRPQPQACEEVCLADG